MHLKIKKKKKTNSQTRNKKMHWLETSRFQDQHHSESLVLSSTVHMSQPGPQRSATWNYPQAQINRKACSPWTKNQERGTPARPSGEIYPNPYLRQWQPQSSATATKTQCFQNHPSIYTGQPYRNSVRAEQSHNNEVNQNNIARIPKTKFSLKLYLTKIVQDLNLTRGGCLLEAKIRSKVSKHSIQDVQDISYTIRYRFYLQKIN